MSEILKNFAGKVVEKITHEEFTDCIDREHERVIIRFNDGSSVAFFSGASTVADWSTITVIEQTANAD